MRECASHGRRVICENFRGCSSRSFDVVLKLRVIHHAEASSKAATAKAFNIHRKCVQTYIKQKQVLTETVGGRHKKKRLTGGERKPANSDLEEKLFKWIWDRRLYLLEKWLRQKLYDCTMKKTKQVLPWLLINVE